MKKTVLFLSALLCGISTSNAQDCQDLFISEYVEGWSNNKALEIYNPTANAIDLSGYIVARASNGTTLSAIQVKYAVQLTGTIAPYSTYVGVVGLTNPAGTGQTAPVWDSLQAKADGFYSPDYNTNSTFYWNGNDAVLLLKGTLSGSPTTTLVSISPALSIVDIFGKIGEDPGTVLGWTSLAPYVNNGAGVSVDHSMIRKSSVLKGVTDDGISFFNPLGEYDSIPPVTYVVENGDTIRNNDLSPKLFGNWFSLGTHHCDCAPASLDKIAKESMVTVYPNPNNGSFFIQGISNFETVEIINSIGQRVEKISNNSKAILAVGLAGKGVYFVRCTNSSGDQLIKRVIIR
jgi:hypothetical protein